MFWQRVRFALLAGVVAAATVSSARADDCCAPAPCAPTTRTVCVQEWVPEKYQATRTVYKTQCRQETYTAYKCECVPVTKTRCVTVNKMVPECKDVVRNYCVCVPVCTEKTVMQPCWTNQCVTKMVKKCVDKGHYECRCVPCKPSLCERIHEACKKHREGCCYCPPPVKTKMEKCWVPCKVWVECPVTCMQKVCTYKPVTVKCMTYKKEMRQEVCKVTCCKCVAEQRMETYTVLCKKMVPFQATRTVSVCVPCQETVTCCRMVCRTVQKQVSCCETCCTPCCSTKKCHKFGGLFAKKSCCCD